MNLFPKKNLTRKKGFTLTEVLIVVLVISVLSAIAYPIYTKSATKSRAVEAISLLEMVRNKQLFKYARDKAYYTDVTSLGQITSNKKQESISEQELKVKDYTISLNAAKNCATAAYEKGTTKFSFSSGYENTGLGCTGDVCSSFGNIIGGASDVCNCNGATPCGAGFTRNQNTCACECNSCVVNGACVAPTQTQPASRACGSGGTQSRSCTASCDGGTCGPWGACTGQTCPASSKPISSESCGNCGTHTRTVTCDGNTGTWTTAAWGSCTAEGVCTPNATQSCGSGGTQTCTSSCQWSSTCVEAPCPATCSDGYIRTSATTGNSSTCCSCPSPKTTKLQNGACDVNGNCQASKFICVCPNSNDYTKCTTTGGTWNDTTCSCTCPTTGKNPFDSTTGCACPTNKAWLNWRLTSGYGAGPAAKQCICSNAIDYNANAGGACTSTDVGNAMEAKCKGLFCTLSDYCSLSTGCRFVTGSDAAISPSQKFEAERTAAGTWNPTTCSCTCPAGGTLTDGRCFMCTSPLVWNGSSCVCQLACGHGFGTVDTYGYNTNAVLSSTECKCVCPTGWTWGYHGVTNLGQQVQSCAPTSTCSGESTRACGNCNTGTQTRQCNLVSGAYVWSDWSACTGGGACAPGATQACGTSGTQTCSSSCSWGTCSGQTCPAATQPAVTQSCGNCSTGTQTRTVTCNTSTYTWTTGSWGTCSGGGACAPGETKMEMCGTNTGYQQAGREEFVYQTLTCKSSCTWPAVTPCDVCYENPNCGKDFGGGLTGKCYCTLEGDPIADKECPIADEPSTAEHCGNCSSGTRTRTATCNTDTGTWETSSWSACSGETGCTPGATQACGSGGTQTCSSSCAWGTCSGQTCPAATKPAATQSCGNCSTGTQTRTVTCNTSTYAWTTGSWGTCSGVTGCTPGATQTCNTNGTKTCSTSCSWGTCACPAGSSYNSSVSRCCTSAENGLDTRDGGCCVELSSCGSGGVCRCYRDSPLECSGSASQACGNCNTGTQTRTCNTTTGQWGSWSACSGVTGCTPGATQACGNGGTQTCSSSCTWGTCQCPPGQPAASQACGNCNTGTQTRTVTCSNGAWVTGSWSTCSGGGTCTPGATKACGSSGIQTCSSSCSWSECACNPATKPSGREDCNDCGIRTATITCNASTGAWSTVWSSCKGHYSMAINCCDGHSFTVYCKAGGAWNLMPSCSYVNDPDCTDSYRIIDPILD